VINELLLKEYHIISPYVEFFIIPRVDLPKVHGDSNFVVRG
jgi:hypothetical protein